MNERIKVTNIQRKIRKINKDEAYMTKLVKFLKTVKGQEMVNNIDKRPINALLREFGAPKATHRNDRQQYNLLRAAMHLAKVKPTIAKNNIVDYTNLLRKKQLNGELKLSKSLSHGELKDMNKSIGWVIKKDNSGNPIIKTDSEGKQLYYIGSNKPMYKWTPKKSPGLAFKMHLLEMYKMKKWDAKNPAPTETDLKQDLFPEELVTAHRTRRYIHLENVRELLSVKYCGGKRTIPDLRVFEVYKIPDEHQKYAGANKFCEVERYDDAYCLAGFDKNTSNATLKNKLEDHIKSLTSTPMGDKTVGFKIYDNIGNLRVSIAA